MRKTTCHKAPTFLLTTFVILTLTSALSAQTVMLHSLLDEMPDRATLAKIPSPWYICKQASSYDRRSVAFVRSEKHGDREEGIMIDAQGSGTNVSILA